MKKKELKSEDNTDYKKAVKIQVIILVIQLSFIPILLLLPCPGGGGLPKSALCSQSFNCRDCENDGMCTCDYYIDIETKEKGTVECPRNETYRGETENEVN